MEFGFFRGLPRNLFFLDMTGQVAFLIDIILQFFVAYRDSQTYKMVYKRMPIALRLDFSLMKLCSWELSWSWILLTIFLCLVSAGI